MPAPHRALEVLGVAAAAALGLGLAAGLWRACGWADAPLLLLAALAAPLAADGLSGAVHWWADRVASERTPWLGPHFVLPFREHHVDPAGIGAHDFVETNGNTCLVLLAPLAALLWLAPRPETGAGALFLHAFALALGGFLALTNQIHKWAHVERAPETVCWAQRHHLLLDPARHAVHHAAPFDRSYCITTGWLNPALDSLGAFARLERALRRGRSGSPT